MDDLNREFERHSPIHCCSPTVKTLMAGLFVILLTVTAVYMIFAALNAFKQSRYIGQDVERINSITISGEGKIQAKPDIAMVTLGVVSQATNVASAQKDNTEKMNKITKAMKDLGIDEKDLKTINYSIYPRYNYESGRQNIIGYDVSQSLEVKIRDLDKISSVLSKAAGLGANQVGSLAFTFDDPEKLKVEARSEAIKNAKEKAQVLTDELGVNLGRVIDFSESSNAAQPPKYYAEKALGMGGDGASPDIQTGENEITANVTITYEIRKK